MKKYRIGVAFFYHESHTFSPSKTTISDFEKEAYLKGNDILEHYQGTKTEVGGFIDVLNQHDQVEIIPLVCAAAIPSGTVTDEAYQDIRHQLIGTIEQSGELDAILIALHGAMVVESISDPETAMLKEIRQAVRNDLPIATTLDLHGNIGAEMVKLTPLHFGFKTYPHVDMYEQGYKAAETIMELLINQTTYYASLAKLPVLLPSINMRTAEGPMRELTEKAKSIEESDINISAVTIFGGFPYSDIPEAGTSALIVGTNQRVVDRVAEEFTQYIWEYKEKFIYHLPTIDEAVQEAISFRGKKPIVLADISDNPLSGGTGDTTGLLSKMVDANIDNSLFGALYDEESLQICQENGAGSTVQLSLGGKWSSEFGEPIGVKAEVIHVTTGKFRNKGPMNTGVLVNTNGATHIRVGNMDILITGRALSANDPELFRHIGIEPTEKNVIAMKVKNHFRSSFEDLMERVLYVDAPGLASNDLTVFDFRHIPRPIWPLDNIDYDFELTRSK
ncbi:M81 family metallopeptidase [Virgibacillus byunsanensis]|uniref:M81 family metallopeptidase n=1 Tax=Virgibacillus byunsanensis TaxID=570945 RepID=A0ABW3LFX9_9BACI